MSAFFLKPAQDHAAGKLLPGTIEITGFDAAEAQHSRMAWSADTAPGADSKTTGLSPLGTGTDPSLPAASSERSSSQTLAGNTITLAPGATINGTDQDDWLGDPDSTSSQSIYGGAGWDTIWGGSGADELHGEADSDYLVGGAGSDLLDGGDGDGDMVSYYEETGSLGVVVNLSDAAWTYGGTTYAAQTGSDSWGDLDRYVGIDQMYGTAGGDVIYAANSAQALFLFGNEGDDTLTGSGDDDTLCGGAGDDTYVNGQIIFGEVGVTVDLLAGTATGEGNDTLVNVRHVVGSWANDVLRAGIYSATLEGGAGDDVIFGGSGYDRLLAGTGADTLYGSGSNDYMLGNGNTAVRYETWTSGRIVADMSAGAIDKYSGGARLGADSVYKVKDLSGTAFGDWVLGTVFANRLEGLAGGDTIVGNSGNDTIDGGDGNDSLDGSYDSDSLLGGAGIDTLEGGDGNDTLDGGVGADSLAGGFGNDTYYIDDLGDIVVEEAGSAYGTDTVYLAVADYDGSKLANIENVVLIGNGSISTGNAAPQIGGADEPVSVQVADTSIATPFSALTITDDSASVTLTVSMDAPSKGAFTHLGSGTYDAQAGTYTVTGSAAEVQAALQALEFDPTDRPAGAVGSVETTQFTLSVVDSDGASATPNDNISVDATASNRVPTLSYVSQTLSIADTENTNLVAPFTNIVIADQNAGDVLTASIQLSDASHGVLVPVQGGSYDAATGTFTVTGLVDEVRAAIASLLFNPTDRFGAEAGSIERTKFSIAVADASGAFTFASDVAIVDSIATGAIGNSPPATPELVGGTVAETAQAGDLAGTFSASDPNGDPVTFTFADAQAGSDGLISADGRFVIEGNAVKLVDPSLIDVDHDTVFSYGIVASDDQGNASTGAVAITVTNVNHTPTDLVLSDLKIRENDALGTRIGVLSASDGDHDALAFTLLDDAGGRVRLVGDELQVNSTTKIDYEQQTSFDVTVAVSDGTDSIVRTFTIDVKNLNREIVHGESAADMIRGGVGGDTLTGGDGNDTLSGGDGHDVLRGDWGADVFLFDRKPQSPDSDVIQDFSIAQGDRIQFDHAIFKGFGLDLGTLDLNAFTNGTEAHDRDDRIIYDRATGRLWYDADGAVTSGYNAQQVLIATLSTKPALTHESVFII
jgi:Ca2+-binding RTX toxin-like protein